MKKAKDAMEYEDSTELFTKKTKTNKKVKEMKELKTAAVKSTDIYKMGSGAIMWYLIKRHKFALSVTLNVVLVLVYSAGGKQLLHLIWR